MFPRFFFIHYLLLILIYYFIITNILKPRRELRGQSRGSTSLHSNSLPGGHV